MPNVSIIEIPASLLPATPISFLALADGTSLLLLMDNTSDLQLMQAITAPIPPALLLADGVSFFLLADNVSYLLLGSGAAVAATPTPPIAPSVAGIVEIGI